MSKRERCVTVHKMLRVKFSVVEIFNFCPVSFKKKGCYRNNHHGDYHLHELLFTDRDSSSSAFSGIKKATNDFHNYVLKLICRCAEKANQNQFTYFAIQHNGMMMLYYFIHPLPFL